MHPEIVSEKYTQRLLNRFYAVFSVFCLSLLLVGVPFIFYRKLTSAISILIVLAGVLVAWKLSQKGRHKTALSGFSVMLWLVLVGLIFAGLSPNGGALALVMSTLLTIVISTRAGLIFGISYLLAWLAYIVLGILQLAPAPYFLNPPLTGWIIVVGSGWLLLMTIPETVGHVFLGEDMQRSVLEATTDALLVVDSVGKVNSFNQKFVDLWAIPPVLQRSKNDSELLDFLASNFEDKELFLNKVQELYAHPTESSFDTLQLKDGRFIERYSQPHVMRTRIVGRVWSFRDVTEIKVAQISLQNSNEKFQGLFELSPLGMARNGMDGVFHEANPAFLKMLGVSLLELNSMSYWDVTPESYSELEAQQLQRLQSTGAYGPYEKEYIHRDGHKFPVRLNGMVIQDAEGIPYIWSIIEDITIQKNNEFSLTEARSIAEGASRAKGEFLANMSHEIRTPMNAVIGLLSLLQSTELTPQQRDYARKTDGAAKSLLGLINDILDFSKVEAGKMQLESEPFRIDELLRNLSVVLSANLGAKNIEVLFDVDPTLPDLVKGDAMRLQQVLVNLAGNAIKFTSQGQVVVVVRRVQATSDTTRIDFSVQDSGIGIAPEHQTHIFAGFSQAEASTTRRFGGTGLGLAISRRLVEMMGGQIGITSVVGVGSTFSFTLEFPQIGGTPSDCAEPARSNVSPRSVLVVDDNPVAGELMLGMIRSWGWPADLAANGFLALEMLNKATNKQPATFPYPLIYMDWKMPGMDGWETTRQIRQIAQQREGPQPIIIMLSANGRENLAYRSEEEQKLINGFVVKPATASMLLDAVADATSDGAKLRQVAFVRSSRRQLAGMRILVVEDNLINQQVADELLSAEGAIVSLAANGQLGVDAVKAAAPQFDVVLMDVQMPVLDGYQATGIIRNELGLDALPIIAMTANAMASDRDACLAAGMNEHVGKPFDIGKLVSLLIRMTEFKASADDMSGQSSEGSMDRQLDDFPGLDLKTALSRMSGMRSLYVRTARYFTKTLDTIIPALRENLQAGQVQKGLMVLHSLKGNAGTLGAIALAKESARLELMLKTGGEPRQLDSALDDLAALAEDTQQMINRAVTLLDQPEGAVHSNGVVFNSEIALAALTQLDTLLIASDMQALEKFAEVRSALAALPELLCDQLEDALHRLDLTKAHHLCSQAIARLSVNAA
ncbi:MAG: response regulator [Rhodoferax sp.]|nr:response regulator [Rhodoferax sp.]